MPLVRIDMIKGKSAEYKKKVLECVHLLCFRAGQRNKRVKT